MWPALDAGIYIPNLCSIREASKPHAGCRLCFIEVEGKANPVTSCTEPVVDGMVIRTTSPAIIRLRRSAFNLLMSNHYIDCRNCAKNRTCELQKIAPSQKFKLKSNRLPSLSRTIPVDSSHPCFSYDRNKCVLCGKCIWVCEKYGTGELQFAYRGIQTVVTTIGNEPGSDTNCNLCDKCVSICPTGAMVGK
ncbi:MAG: 2Fe-2S iron-sulfur cluster-binding protein [Chloroflexi bacterium]|nr:2Fe-2S iron-sulfur cluster-binding protein [Chloroflexota bacterium]